MGSTRREFLYAAMAASAAPAATAAGPYTVGVANVTSYGQPAYDGTQSAIDSAGGFPNVAGKTVVVKTNLVAAYSAESGTTTSIDVVRAVVDRALAGGAAAVKIVELPGLGQQPVPFAALGYDFFDSYDPRVSTLDLASDTMVLTGPVPNAFDFPEGFYLPATVADPNAVIISVAKLKSHSLTVVTGATKNLFGLYSGAKYRDTTNRQPLPRGYPHILGVDGSIVDVLLALGSRAAYHVVDAVVGMQGDGPLPVAVFTTFGGTPVNLNCILAGANPIAVDWVGAEVLQTPYPGRTMHLSFAAYRGLGPASLAGVTLAGDPLTPVAAQPAAVSLPPQIWPGFFPSAATTVGAFASGSAVVLGVKNALPGFFPAGEAKLEIIKVDYTSAASPLPPIETVKLLKDWHPLVPGGTVTAAWNGRNAQGQLVSPGVYIGLYSTRYVGVNDPLIVNTTSARLVVG